MTNNAVQRIVDAYLNINGSNQEKQKITVEAIIRQAHVARPTFYDHFDSIGSLSSYIQKEFHREVLEVLQNHHPENQSYPLEVFCDEVLPILYANHTKLHIIYTSLSNPELTHFLEKMYGDWLKPLFLSKKGYYDPFLLTYVTKAVISIISTWLSDPIPYDVNTFKPIFLDLLNTSPAYVIATQCGLNKKSSTIYFR